MLRTRKERRKVNDVLDSNETITNLKAQVRELPMKIGGKPSVGA